MLISALALMVLAVLDGTFAVSCSSIGRSGLVDHRDEDRRGARRGLALGLLLLVPVIITVSADVIISPDRSAGYARLAAGMLTVCLPYGLVVLLALGVYTALHWRLKYLASALILGPFTLIRPAVAVAGGVVGIVRASDLLCAAAAIWAVLAVLAVEPLANRRWYAHPEPPRTAALPR